MQFKVGDRVEAIKPPINLEKSDPDEVGIGVIKEVNPRPFDGAYLVKLDSGPEWAYWESYLRPAPIATPTPSITVGTQVRLTGVVMDHNNTVAAVAIGGMAGSDNIIWVMHDQLEVIRQPFKRGELVWSCGAVATGEQYVVFNDETNGRVDVVHCDTGTATKGNDASRFERRP